MEVYNAETMRLTAKGEYATRAVLHLAMQYPEVVTIHQLADRDRIPVKYLEQILLELKHGGVLISRRGVHGGYLLSRNPADISVGEVLRIVDSRVVDSSCSQSDSERSFACADYYGCGLKQLWHDVNLAVEKLLFDTSFADICASSRRKPLLAVMPRSIVRLNA
jgi:Rrf2 family protein